MIALRKSGLRTILAGNPRAGGMGRGHETSTRGWSIHRYYIEASNAAPKPFWTKNADDILVSTQRFCLRIAPTQGLYKTSESGHKVAWCATKTRAAGAA